jgi:transaldolase
MADSPLKSLIACGTRLWLDSVDPELTRYYRERGVTGATSNPIIIAELVRSGRFDSELKPLLQQSLSDEDVAWRMTESLVANAQSVFADVYESTLGNDGYVSLELDPLLEDVDCPLSQVERSQKYIDSGLKWADGQPNRMIKVPATPGGLNALEELVAGGVTVNVTLIFTSRQYQEARDAVWRGAQRRDSFDKFKSVYSIFVSRVDVYAQTHAPGLSEAARGLLGIANAQRLWQDNHEFWADKNLPLQQEMIFASTGTKNPEDPREKYVAALAGSDIQTNPPSTNEALEAQAGLVFTRQVDQLPPKSVLQKIDDVIDFEHLEETLMADGLRKFAEPQKGLLQVIAEKREALVAAL